VRCGYELKGLAVCPECGGISQRQETYGFPAPFPSLHQAFWPVPIPMQRATRGAAIALKTAGRMLVALSVGALVLRTGLVLTMASVGRGNARMVLQPTELWIGATVGIVLGALLYRYGARIAADVLVDRAGFRCDSCSYKLMGTEDVCPECGTPLLPDD
jgi:hypothetical protein